MTKVRDRINYPGVTQLYEGCSKSNETGFITSF